MITQKCEARLKWLIDILQEGFCFYYLGKEKKNYVLELMNDGYKQFYFKSPVC